MTMMCSNPSCGCIVQGKFCHECGLKAICTSLSSTICCKGLLENGSPCKSEISANHKFCEYCGTCVETVITPTDSKNAKTNLCYSLSSDVEFTDDAEGFNTRCQPCSVKNKSTVATFFCDTCNEYQCSDCSQVHSFYLLMNSHVLISANAAKNILPVIDLSGLDHCIEHNKALEFYCKTENQMCCSICAIGGHRKCEDVTVIDLRPVEEIDKTSTVINKKLDELKEKKSSTTNYLESETVNIQSQSDQLIKTLDSMKVEIMENYSSFAKDTIQQMNTIRDKKLEELNQTKLEFEKLNASLNKEIELYQNVEKHGTSVQKFIIQHKLQELINDNFKQTCKLASSHVTTNIVLEFKDPVNILARSEKEFGSLKVVESRSGENSQAVVEYVKKHKKNSTISTKDFLVMPESLGAFVIVSVLANTTKEDFEKSIYKTSLPIPPPAVVYAKGEKEVLLLCKTPQDADKLVGFTDFAPYVFKKLQPPVLHHFYMHIDSCLVNALKERGELNCLLDELIALPVEVKEKDNIIKVVAPTEYQFCCSHKIMSLYKQRFIPKNNQNDKSLQNLLKFKEVSVPMWDIINEELLRPLNIDAIYKEEDRKLSITIHESDTLSAMIQDFVDDLKKKDITEIPVPSDTKKNVMLVCSEVNHDMGAVRCCTFLENKNIIIAYCSDYEQVQCVKHLIQIKLGMIRESRRKGYKLNKESNSPQTDPSREQPVQQGSMRSQYWQYLQHMIKKDDVSAVINAGIIKYLFGKGEIYEWISKVKNKFDVNVAYDNHCNTCIVCGSVDAMLRFQNFLDNFFPNDPDQYKQKETDPPSKDVEQLNISKVDSAAVPVAAGKGQTLDNIQLHEANKNIQKDHSNYLDQDNKISIDIAISTAAKGQTQENVLLARANKSVPKGVNICVDQYHKSSIGMHTDAAVKVQTQKDIQLHGANKSIQNDHRNYFQDTPNEKQIDRIAGREKLAHGPREKLKLRVTNNSIIVCPVDCLIISCNFTLSTSIGIMKAVEEAAGNEFTKACQDEYKRCQLDIAECRPITAGKLGCKKIILVRGPSNDKFMHADIKTSLWQLQCAYKNALRKADELGFVSVALHAIGKEIWKTNTIDCLRQFIIAIECVKHDITNLEFVHFVEKQEKVCKVVRAFLLENGYDLGGSCDGKENYANPTQTRCDIQARVGKVEDLQVDAAVSTESQHIDGHGKIAHAFLQLGNDNYRKAHLALSKGTCIPTDVLYTKVTGGNIKCKYVLHAIVTEQNKWFTWDTLSCTSDIRRTVCNILRQASELHCTSVALPLIGIRGAHFSNARQSSCTAIIEGMNAFLKSENHSSVKNIVFCSKDKTDVKIFNDLLASKS